MSNLYAVKEKKSPLGVLVNFFKKVLSRKEVVSVRYYKIARRHKPYPKLKAV